MGKLEIASFQDFLIHDYIIKHCERDEPVVRDYLSESECAVCSSEHNKNPAVQCPSTGTCRVSPVAGSKASDIRTSILFSGSTELAAPGEH